MTVRVLTGSEVDRWDQWLGGRDYTNLRQSSGYGRVLQLYGHQPEIVVMESDGEIEGGALLSRRVPSRLIGPVIHTSGGVGLADPGDPDRFHRLLEGLLERSRDAKASSLTVSVRVPELVGEEPSPEGEALATVLRDAGFEREEAGGTYYVDLSGESEEDVLEQCSRNTRRQIRKALRVGLTVEPSLEPRDFEDFEAAHLAMGDRKGLEALPRGIGGLLRPMAESGLGTLFVARFRDEGRNYTFSSSSGHPIPHWAALRDATNDEDCPGTGHALHFGAMAHYHRLGKRFYDFGGAEGPVPDPEHPNYGVWRFKYEFGGTYVQFVGTWKRKLDTIGSAVIDLARRGRRLKGRFPREIVTPRP